MSAGACQVQSTRQMLAGPDSVLELCQSVWGCRIIDAVECSDRQKQMNTTMAAVEYDRTKQMTSVMRLLS